jgi:hypothetical protein
MEKITFTKAEIKHWKSLTQDNCHTQVRVLIAERLKKENNRFAIWHKLFDAFNEYQEDRGGIRPHESYVRNDLTESMLEAVEQWYGIEAREEITKCL